MSLSDESSCLEVKVSWKLCGSPSVHKGTAKQFSVKKKSEVPCRGGLC